MKKIPTIKGIFVMSHVRALERAKGKDAVHELVERCGMRVRFKNTDNVPVRDEITIIENALDILSGNRIRNSKREFEAGRLHFRNFSRTPLGRLVLSMFGFKSGLLKAGWIAERVFNGVEFKTEDTGKGRVRITMSNNDYPLKHFQGFFKAWMEHAKLRGTVAADDRGDGCYIYTLRWK